ncbi:hypothetical protein BMW24_014345 [Mycobacterium heckeshornense]|uniref:Uncharacterized protein n=1 Tax=Mycobacterium heckeshornense TaxID=110505 RepID=A0A2G8B7L4_9MYCO|nr:hypothetical protein [Mycobacterium heckeshornense]KMV24059.1 hypothetical protein ACT16_03605 [Mycobacterium heckeshornense]MCV7036609.1 hypothetical protein [Mycobacterium heckeshornense]PIJ33724.1 hypothetical protein BMW24_014345 [Mycobacterium heckeshornense]BCO34477.1 hypothetical protein MHEC_09100 [Mycobacterium heckeshornense]BCQ07615.1 hypothetical protein JMUB5695_01036 [Mycobacterium heckeshornense]
MRSMGTIATAIGLTASVFGAFCPVPWARATTKEEVALNGTYRATSIGDWAKTNDQFNNEATVVSTWTMNSSCATFYECTGTVRSDQGWSAPLYTVDGTSWYVKREVPNWERCPDGTAYPGQQTFYFYPVNASSAELELGSPVLAGKDRTLGPSGACGRNQWLMVEMPFRLDKIG